MNHILVIAGGESDLLDLLKRHCRVTVKSFSERVEDEGYDALCVLGGTEGGAAAMSAKLHNLAEKMHDMGKPTFFEYVGAIFLTRQKGAFNTARQRMIFTSTELNCEGVGDGDLLDGQSNDCLKYGKKVDTGRPVLTYKESICAHTSIKMTEEQLKEGNFALWWYDDNALISCIRLANFHKSRFSPVVRWQGIISGIVEYLAGEKIALEFAPPVCTYNEKKITSAHDAEEVVKLGLDWIEKAEMLKDGGKLGAREGFSNRITAKTGTHMRNNNVRADCTNELGGALMLDAIIRENEKSREYAGALFGFTFDNFQIKSGEHKGMLRWSEAGWYDCYADDVARAMIPALLCQFFGEDVPHLDEIKDALDYLVETTAEDGIRTPCTQICTLTKEKREQIKVAGSSEPCAHFNAYYHAALLLAYNVCKEEKYLDYATRGLTTLIAHHPDTRRETSETEEYCRLIFPLATLYLVTGDDKHREWLCRVVDDLQKFRHPSGGYAEWDSGYKAGCSRNHNGECALLADNGDPVADLLYSNNWLPLAFSMAYYATGEKRFYDLWCDSASFVASAQMHSTLPGLNGAWARAFDMDARENYGIPHDKGWGPYCIESGWTVGEILIGLQFMHAAEKRNATKNS